MGTVLPVLFLHRDFSAAGTSESKQTAVTWEHLPSPHHQMFFYRRSLQMGRERGTELTANGLKVHT